MEDGDRASTDLGSLCFVLHTHLPWVAHHGAWPVGEEWLHQAWAQSYTRIFSLLTDLGEQGHRDVLTVGITPVLAAQLDDPYCLQAHHEWLGNWQLRASGLAGMRDADRRAAGHREYRAATDALTVFESDWRHGASPIIRGLLDDGVIDILGGPLTHTFTPDLSDHWAGATLRAGLDDYRLRWGSDAAGIWTPECAYRPGLEDVFGAAGVDHLMLEGPTLLSAGATTDAVWQLADSDVRVVGRDLPLAYRVWSPKRGYPGGRWYRDFHSYDHEWGMKTHRVTHRSTPPELKAPYDPERAAHAVTQDAWDFVAAVRSRLLEQRTRHPDRLGLAVVAYDTELFGHWWHEGPQWLAEVLQLLPKAGITPRSLSSALSHRDVAGRVQPGPGSWGTGKDFRVWSSAATSSIRAEQSHARDRVARILAKSSAMHVERSPAHDQLVTSLLLGLASDWVFMVSKDSAADYARSRVDNHLADVHRIADSIEAGSSTQPHDHSDEPWSDEPWSDEPWWSIGERDRPWGHVDARTFST